MRFAKTFYFLLICFLTCSNVRGQYADLGSGKLKNDIWWIDWNNFKITDGATHNITTNTGLSLTIKFSKISGEIPHSSNINTWSGSILPILYNFSDKNIQPALYTTINMIVTKFTMTITAIRNGLPAPLSLVLADAEASATNEQIRLQTNGTEWEMIELFRNSPQLVNPLIGCGTKSAYITNTYDESFLPAAVGQCPIIHTRSNGLPLTLDITFDKQPLGGATGIAIGVLESFDRGDLPPTYGYAQHKINYLFKNTCNYNTPFPQVEQNQALYLGKVPGDADGEENLDDNAEGFDEDAIDEFRDYDGSGTYIITVPLKNTTGKTTYLSGWFDYNQDGKFSENERVTVRVPNNSTAANLSWIEIPANLLENNTTSFAFRFRISSDENAVNNPIGIADDGEIEDYFVALRSSKTGSLIINDYAAVFDFDLCKNMLSVDDAKAFKTGDTVLLIQMKGAIIDSSDNPSFGQITDYNNSGNYEFNIVKSRVGNSIYLLNNLVRDYDFQNGKVQLVRVPYYQNIAFDKTLTSLAWDGNKGGILALNVGGTLTLSADMDVTGKGFRSGTKLQNSRVTSNATGYYFNSGSNNGGEKGEGVSNISNDKKYGRGSLSNGGGGGNAHNAGGGGGANGGGGGQGGDQYEPLKSIAEKIGGKGGKALANNSTLNKLFMGGAGGMGQANDLAEFPAGNGGGIIIISANILQANGFSIKANGTNAKEAPSPDDAKDGMAGGGGGGSISLAITNLADNIKVEAKGGKGADQTSTSYGGKAGSGGGGGGGIVALSQNAVSGQYSIDLSGGVNGVDTGYGDDAWGAEPGEDGVIITGIASPIAGILFKQGIDSVRFTDNLNNCHQLSFDGEVFGTNNNIVNWDWNFGDGTSGSIPNPVHDYSSEGTFNVRLVVTNSNACTDSIIKSIKVYSDKIDISNDTAICIHSSVQLTSSIGGQAYYWTPAGDLDNPNITNPVAAPAATTKYFVSVVKAPGCIVSDSVLIKVNPLPAVNAARSNDITCSRPQSQLNTYGTAVNFSWTPVEDLNVSTIANPIASPKSTKTFTVVGTDINGCKQSDSVKVIVDFSDKPFTGMANAFTPNHDGLNDCFGVSHLNIISDLDFRIYNRFGQLIFKTNDPAKCWDGTFKGEPQNSGVFIYTVKGTGSCNMFNLKGKVVLIR